MESVIKIKPVAEEISTNQIFLTIIYLSSSFINAVDQFNFLHAKINMGKGLIFFRHVIIISTSFVC